ncbi:MAG: DEAD/DEAH box helicase [Gemmataceae bacterium]
MAGKPAELLEFQLLPSSMGTALSCLPEPIASWFRSAYGQPTACQIAAWPVLAAEKNLLLCAPTGTGKTLAAFLPLFGELLNKAPQAGVRCLYIAPLKALANDALKNLRTHLRGIEQHRKAPGYCPTLSQRTGDSSAKDRRGLRSKPADILLSTPESLAILLSQPMSKQLFALLRWVVVDEIHALASNKRGADLSLSLERLSDIAEQPIQRIGLSATCTPLEEVARFLAGSHRTCTIASISDSSSLQVQIEPLFKGTARANDWDSAGDSASDFLGTLVERLQVELETHSSTLIFTNARGLAERLAWRLRKRHPDWDGQIAVHHSALAKERRRDVEERLKRGDLRAVVSSTSLELGIDIGSVENVVLVHPPGAVTRFLQRVGRSGHQPDTHRRGLILAANAAELLEAAVTGACGQLAQNEPITISAHPLDVLCQHLVGMASSGIWQADDALDLVRRAYPYESLSRTDFDDCLNYLSGKRRDGTDWLPPRLRWEDGAFTICDEFTARLLRRNLGTILGEEVRSVRVSRGTESEMVTTAPVSPLLRRRDQTREIGQLDDQYADRLKPGDRFLLDGRCLEFRRAEGWDVLVNEVLGRPVTPRWYGAGWPISAQLARHLYDLRTRAGEALRDGEDALGSLLREEYGLNKKAVEMLGEYFRLQECISEIPDAATCLIENVPTEQGTDYYLHAPLNQPANQALAQVIVRRLAAWHGAQASSVVADLGLIVSIRRETRLTPTAWRDLQGARDFKSDCEESLLDSEMLRERFQRIATTGLMLLRQPLGGRRRVGGRDWGRRRLFGQVRDGDASFVLIRQAMEEVQEECCDIASALSYLGDIPSMTLRCRQLNQPSPFAQHWTQLKPGPDEETTNPVAALERLHAELTSASIGRENGVNP